jgi:hypothetical protein
MGRAASALLDPSLQLCHLLLYVNDIEGIAGWASLITAFLVACGHKIPADAVMPGARLQSEFHTPEATSPEICRPE